jgi:hypothetical protein
LIDSKNDSTFIPDNNAYFDSNPVSGSYLLKGLTPGTYQVCQHNSPTYYLVANPACLTANVTTGRRRSLVPLWTCTSPSCCGRWSTRLTCMLVRSHVRAHRLVEQQGRHDR